jgi:hypothetical protein
LNIISSLRRSEKTMDVADEAEMMMRREEQCDVYGKKKRKEM